MLRLEPASSKASISVSQPILNWSDLLSIAAIQSATQKTLGLLSWSGFAQSVSYFAWNHPGNLFSTVAGCVRSGLASIRTTATAIEVNLPELPQSGSIPGFAAIRLA